MSYHDLVTFYHTGNISDMRRYPIMMVRKLEQTTLIPGCRSQSHGCSCVNTTGALRLETPASGESRSSRGSEKGEERRVCQPGRTNRNGLLSKNLCSNILEASHQ